MEKIIKYVENAINNKNLVLFQKIIMAVNYDEFIMIFDKINKLYEYNIPVCIKLILIKRECIFEYKYIQHIILILKLYDLKNNKHETNYFNEIVNMYNKCNDYEKYSIIQYVNEECSNDVLKNIVCGVLEKNKDDLDKNIEIIIKINKTFLRDNSFSKIFEYDLKNETFIKIIDTYYDENESINTMIIQIMYKKKEYNYVKKMLEKNVQINKSNLLFESSKSGIHKIAYKLLIDKKINEDDCAYVDENGINALMYACINFMEKVSFKLLNCDGKNDVCEYQTKPFDCHKNTINNNGDTCLSILCENISKNNIHKNDDTLSTFYKR